jgi:hypothetical protein
VPSGTSAPVRVARPSGVPVCHADGGAGPGESEEREVVLAGTASKTESLGAPARETACRRGKREGSAIRDARTLRRSDTHPRVSAADSTRGRWGLVAAPWERRRITARTGVANGRVEHPTRAAPAGGRVRAADAPSGDRAHPTRSRLAGTSRRTPLQRRASPEPWSANRKERAPGRGCFDPPLVHVRIVVRRSLDLGTTPGTSFAGVHGSEGGLAAPARRAQAEGTTLDEVSR